MRTLLIENKEYVIEYNIEASLYSECTEKVTGLMAGVAGAENKEDIKGLLSAMADVPQVTLRMFHAGLLEHNEGIPFEESKRLIKQYLKEHKGEETGNFYGLMEMLIGQMADDGFFELIGLGEMFTPTKEPKKPEDHKRKQNAKVIEK